jgi:two-component system, NarL family, nitrate/nitrite response regulator NarL
MYQPQTCIFRATDHLAIHPKSASLVATLIPGSTFPSGSFPVLAPTIGHVIKKQPAAPAHAQAANRQAKTPARPIKVLLADDHPVVRKGIASCLAREERVQIIGEAGDGLETLRQAKALSPDIVLMDIDMPGMSGLAVTEALRRERPGIRILILSMFNNPDDVVRILQSGASGYLLKQAPIEELVKAIDTIHDGEAYFSPEVAKLAINQFVRGASTDNLPATNLSNREREVLSLVAEGLSNKEIASHLNVGVRTVETHRERIMRKLNIHSIAGLTRFAIAKGIVAFPRLDSTQAQAV